MKLFFGKFAKKNTKFEKQINQRRYYANIGSSWFNGIGIGDYCYILASNNVYLWQAKEYVSDNDGDYLQFESVFEDELPIDTNQFKAFKYFLFNTNIVLTSRQVRGRAFFEIDCTEGFDEITLKNIRTYQNNDNFRAIYVVDQSYEKNSKDIYLIKEADGYSLYKSAFIADETYNSFIDNTNKSSGKRPRKNNTIERIKKTKINSIVGGVSLLSFYDLFFNEYEQSDEDSLEQKVEGKMQNRPKNKKAQPLNQILYGPPGTGKTYNTVVEAVKVCDGALPSNDYGEIKKRYNVLKKEGRIEFVTFHQSYGYEEFIEGIRPVMSKDDGLGDLQFKIEKGVFSKICSDAEVDIANASKDFGISSDANVWKVSIDGTNSSTTRDYCFQNNEARIGWGLSGNPEVRNENENNYYQSLSSTNRNTIDNFCEEIKQGDVLLCIASCSEVAGIGVVSGSYHYDENKIEGVIEDYNHVLPVDWIVKNVKVPFIDLNGGTRFTLKTVYPLWRISPSHVFDRLKREDYLSQATKDKASKQSYVLIIDEINRGNMSKVFGELITLIEDDKRIDAEHEMKVILPTSRMEFGVPENLYIIGTMNTADRSIAMMDTALRRRFEFKEMMPNPCLLHVENVQEFQEDGVSVSDWESIDYWVNNDEWTWDEDYENEDLLVEGVNLRRMLYAINQRIEVLYDREHTIGHAYFMSLNSESSIDDLASVFENKIIPLLAEYFFEDWDKIRMILGDNQKENHEHQFITVDEKKNFSDLFGDKVTNVDYLEERKVFARNKEALNHAESYIGIYKTKSTKEKAIEEDAESNVNPAG